MSSAELPPFSEPFVKVERALLVAPRVDVLGLRGARALAVDAVALAALHLEVDEAPAQDRSAIGQVAGRRGNRSHDRALVLFGLPGARRSP